jgi:hypothetical protein
MSYRAVVAAAALLVLMALAAPAHAQAPDAERLGAAKELMQIAGVAKQFDEVMPYLTRQLAESFVAVAPDKAAEIREVFAQLAVKFVDRKGELIDQIAAVYAEKLALEDLTAIIGFYNRLPASSSSRRSPTSCASPWRWASAGACSSAARSSRKHARSSRSAASRCR